MKKIKYFYNTHSLRYEKLEETFKKKFVKVLGFLSAASVFALIIVYLAYTYLDSPKEKKLKNEISQLQLQYDILNEKLEELSQVTYDLQQRDDNIYRVIFEAEPIPLTLRNAVYSPTNNFQQLRNFQNGELIISTTNKLDRVKKQLYIQSKSYDEINELIKQKKELLASIPAIQPISNKQLTRIGSGFGMRIDPIYKVPKMHTGLDFAAAIGTPIYATGDGVIGEINYEERGYGIHIIINHGFGYKTLYGHMSRVKVKAGQKVQRGDIIGYVGDTGKSTGPHVHYEVIKNNSKIDPVNFFFDDLTPEEYEKLIDLSDRSNQSFD